MLGDGDIGYPSMLYPNLTYIQSQGSGNSEASRNVTQVYAYPDFILNTTSSLFLGPLQVNSTFALVSLTLPIINTTSVGDLLGFMT
jgi:osomolarity two-component system, sensor histidine kinase SLN1